MTATEEKIETRETMKWPRILSVAAAIVTLWAVIMTVLAGEIIPPIIAFGVLFGVIAVLARRRPGKGVYWAGIVFTVLAFAGSAPFVIADLSHPESGLLFVLSVLQVLAMLTVAVASWAALRSWSGESVLAVVIVPLMVFIIAAGVSVALFLGLEDDLVVEGDVLLTSRSAEWGPETITATSGDLGVFIDNKDPYRHSFVIEALDVEIELPASTSRRVEFTAPEGTYSIICTVPGHEKMTGTLVVSG